MNTASNDPAIVTMTAYDLERHDKKIREAVRRDTNGQLAFVFWLAASLGGTLVGSLWFASWWW